MRRIDGFIGRRQLLKLAGFGGCILASEICLNARSSQAAEMNLHSLTPDEALKKLQEGNQRFVKQILEYPDHSQARLKEVAKAQHPFATILSCADSRVPAEIIFDQGLGDIFDVRVAGNIITSEVLGSIEYSTLLLNTPLLMILGHQRCGAVTAATSSEILTASLNSLVIPIQPAIKRVKDKPGDLINNAVIANVEYQLERLRRKAPLIVDRERQGTLKIVGGYYELDTGEVSIL